MSERRMLGTERERQIRTAKRHVRTGDLLAVFSDGIPEAADSAEQEFGEARLAELLVTQLDKPLENIITAVTRTVEKWIHDPEGRDDVTLVLLRKL